MIESAKEPANAQAIALLTYYNFDLGGYTAEQVIAEWRTDYPVNWISWAIIEALYQGRYKGVSVAQILACWKRRNQPLYHFNYEFERLICRNFPNNRNFDTQPEPSSVPATFVTASDVAADADVNPDATPIQPPDLPAEADEPPEEEATKSYDFLQSASAAQSHSTLESTARAAAQELLSQFADQFDSEFANPLATADDPAEKSFIEFINTNQPLQLKRQSAESEATEVKPQSAIETTESAKNSEGHSEPILKKVTRTKYQADWERLDSIKQPINRFIPAAESSDFYSKLKAVSQQPEATAEEEAAIPSGIAALHAQSIEDIDLEKDVWSDD